MLYITEESTACVNLVSIYKFFKQDIYLDRYFIMGSIGFKISRESDFFNIGES